MALKILDWDSDFFGLKIANLDISTHTPSSSFKADNIDLIQCCIEKKNKEHTNFLINNGFSYIDDRVEYILEVPQLNNFENSNIKLATKSDLNSLLKISNGLFTKDSRYNWNNIIPSSKIDEFYNLWLEKSVKGEFDDFCFIYEKNGEIIGFSTIRKIDDKNISIGLIGVKQENHGQGIAQKLIQQIINYTHNNNFTSINVATEGKNLSAQKFYDKNEFRVNSIKSWYYKICN